jgi:hypothetical protein
LFVAAAPLVLLAPCAVAQDQAAAGSGAWAEGEQGEAIWLVDDFEDGNLDGWVNGGGGCSAIATTGTAGQGSWSMEVSGGCSHMTGIYYPFGGFPAQNIGVMIRPNVPPDAHAYFVVGDDNVAADLGVIFFLADPTGNWYIVGENSELFDCGPYTPFQWHDVSFDLDWHWRTLAVRIDGSLCAVNVPFRSTTATTLTQIHAYNFHSSISWYDSIVMSTPPPSPVIFEDGFESADAASWSLSVPALPKVMYLYDGGGVSGAIGGRSGADILCYQAGLSAPGGMPYGTTNRAFISVSAADEIRDMPFDYGVPTDRRIVGPTGIKVADNWADLLDGSIDNSLWAADVTSANFWYSGSNADGSLAPEHCSGWTQGSHPNQGWYGRPPDVTDWWISRGQASCGSSAYTVLCLGWR